VTTYPDALELQEITAYQRDAEESLRYYFKPNAPDYEHRFFGKTNREVAEILSGRIVETEIRSSLAILASIEASFRIDFIKRCRGRLKDDLSRHFRSIEQSAGPRIRLDEDILEGWKIHFARNGKLIGEIRAAFNYRNWLAHGRYWAPKLGRKYDYYYLELLASQVIADFDLTK